MKDTRERGERERVEEGREKMWKRGERRCGREEREDVKKKREKM